MKRLIAVLAALFATACISIDVEDAPAAPPPPAPVTLHFDGLGVLTPPPAAGSPQQAADVATARGPWSAERIAQAAADDAVDPWKAFAGVMAPDFTPANYPETKRAFDQVMAVAGPAIGQTKAQWSRPRPFVTDPRHPTCITPSDGLRASGAYPSGHAALGWAWALVLAEIAPEKANALLRRGFDYGESRVVCGLHWASDVAAGRALGAAAVARMHGDPGTRIVLDAARAEIRSRNVQ
jgi:acid phosphatase (class A)